MSDDSLTVTLDAVATEVTFDPQPWTMSASADWLLAGSIAVVTVTIRRPGEGYSWSALMGPDGEHELSSNTGISISFGQPCTMSSRHGYTMDEIMACARAAFEEAR